MFNPFMHNGEKWSNSLSQDFQSMFDHISSKCMKGSKNLMEMGFFECAKKFFKKRAKSQIFK